MKKSFSLIELIFIILILGLLSSIAVPKFLKLKNHTIIESMSYILSKGIDKAVESALNYMYLEHNTTFKLGDILIISEKELTTGLKWNYTINGAYNKDGTYSLRDETYSTPKVVMRITLDKDERVIRYRINCKNLKQSTHGELRKMCIDKWGDEDIQENISF